MAYERKTLSFDPDVFAAAQEAANNKDMSLSAWLDTLIRKALPPDVRKSLPKKQGRGRPRKEAEA